jgi:hypothetical protein
MPHEPASITRSAEPTVADLACFVGGIDLARQERGRRQQRCVQLRHESPGHRVIGNAHADGLALRVQQPAGQFAGSLKDEGVAARREMAQQAITGIVDPRVQSDLTSRGRRASMAPVVEIFNLRRRSWPACLMAAER